MLRTSKTVLNGAFLLFAVGGFALIFFDQQIDHQYLFFAPTALVMFYALLVHRLLANCYEQTLADHHIDSVYFLGFLFTLVSLITLFYRLQSGLNAADGSAQISQAFYYVGVSVSTSIAGVLFRNMARGAWLRDHPEDSDNLEKSYQLLKSIADSFSVNYRQTFEQIQLFLSERRESLSVLSDKETEYLAALERFIGATNGFSHGLDHSGRELSARLQQLSEQLALHGETVAGFTQLGAAFTQTAAQLHTQAERAPLAAINQELEQFHGGVGELNRVLDSVITLLEARVERVG
ncbi:MAG: hypothetical protein EA404_02120 [Spirochaetaceae bacterium]|nr:MAG: hypothetical protein EA404_02120 [Spirochaetaceae bacterium]